MNIISTLGFLDYFLSPLTKDYLLEPWEYNSVYNGLVWGTNADCSRARGEQCQGPTDRPQTRRPDRTTEPENAETTQKMIGKHWVLIIC